MRRGKLFIILCSVSTLSIFLILKADKVKDNVNFYRNHNCFRLPFTNVRQLQDIDEAEKKPSLEESDRQIFFLETSCTNREGKIHLTARQACGIESMARMHPNHKVYVLFTAPVGFQLDYPEPEVIQNLLKYENVFLRFVDLTKYAQNTPLEDFFGNQTYRASKYFNTHLSDILRFVTLYKYGGLYLDTDIVCLKDFTKLGMNYVAAEAGDSLGSSVINFGNDELGRFIVTQCLEELRATFDGNQWAHNGPGVLTRVISRLCSTRLTVLMTPDVCYGLKVLPIETFAPLLWTYHTYYFEEENMRDVMRLLDKAYVIHLFNHINKHIPVHKSSNVAYAVLAKEHCPDMFFSINETF